MTARADYTDAEWAALRRAPVLAGVSIGLADPGGPLESEDDLMAIVRAVAETPAGEGELAGAVASDVRDLAEHRLSPVAELSLAPRTAELEIRDQLARVNAILAAKATPREAAAFKRWVLDAARRAAGGRVSDAERRALDSVADLLAVPQA